jgi:uncharacterized protein (TIGR02145 family)
MKTYGYMTIGTQEYKTVEIGTQTWMAENSNYVPSTGNSSCYENDTENCNKYGRLYDWATAMNISSTYNSNTYSVAANHKGICPTGWHIPSDDDWNTLIAFIHEDNDLDSYTPNISFYAGKYLKATSGWNNDNGNGSDTYGFSALPSGIGTSVGTFSTAGDGGYLWSTSQYLSSSAYCGYMYLYNTFYDLASFGEFSKLTLRSVRCVKND